MDPYSLQIANLLVGNRSGEAALEAVLIGPSLEALDSVSIAICGGNLSPRIDGQDVPLWKSRVIKKGQVLSFGPCKEGGRAYISMAGGINVPLVLNSKSTFVNGKFGGYEGRALKAGDILHGAPFTVMNRFVHPDLVPKYNQKLTVRVILGPHLEKFTEATIGTFLTKEYTVSPQSNRMGYQLIGPTLEHSNSADIISDAIPLGGIQVPASGQPIILMAERQTTGGYTRIGTVISADIPLLAQALPGTLIMFKEVGLTEAQDLLKQMNRELKWLETGARVCR
ncbi:antagonist of KipI [Neobacillus ginsengisoli]|uniref:Antagonist of KipI n=2 Tax=Neobacillus ginsengisoli TaxID=904295 RepID=A0ABT9XUE3_9BACI|nr:antagonist of KipI [Neobacillus ginsengisoli]